MNDAAPAERRGPRGLQRLIWRVGWQRPRDCPREAPKFFLRGLAVLRVDRLLAEYPTRRRRRCYLTRPGSERGPGASNWELAEPATSIDRGSQPAGVHRITARRNLAPLALTWRPWRCKAADTGAGQCPEPMHWGPVCGALQRQGRQGPPRGKCARWSDERPGWIRMKNAARTERRGPRRLQRFIWRVGWQRPCDHPREAPKFFSEASPSSVLIACLRTIRPDGGDDVTSLVLGRSVDRVHPIGRYPNPPRRSTWGLSRPGFTASLYAGTWRPWRCKAADTGAGQCPEPMHWGPVCDALKRQGRQGPPRGGCARWPDERPGRIRMKDAARTERRGSRGL